MARISQEGFEGQTDSNSSENLTIDALGMETIEVPSSDFISNSDIARDGQNLVLESPTGQLLTVQNYFSAENAPLIESPDGSILTGNLVNSFLSSDPQFAQMGSLNDVSPIGAVEEITGVAQIIRTDGTSEALTLGTPVYQGDTIETSNDGAVNIVFIDETSMAVSQNARLSLDEYQFDPSTESGTTNLSVLRGVFVFTSGLIGRDDPDDVMIDTPVGSIGIRGTIIAGNIQPGGNSEISVLEGAIVIQNGLMETTLSEQYETVSLSSFRSNIVNTGVQKAEKIEESYGSVQNVLPKLFSSINDNIRQEKSDRKSIRAKEKAEEKEEILEVEDKKEEKEAQQPEAKEAPVVFEPVGLDIASHSSGYSNPFAKIFKLIRKIIQRFLDRFDFDKPDVDDPINPDVLEPPELELSATPERVFEGLKNNVGFLRVTAEGGEKGDISFEFEGGGTASADGNYELQAISGRVAIIKLTVAGKSALDAGTIGTTIPNFKVVATDSAGKTSLISLDPVLLDATVNLNTSGGLNFSVQAGVSAPEKSIGDFDGDGANDIAAIGSSTDRVSINGIDIGNVITGTSTNSFDGVGDVNNDGFDDFVYGGPGAGNGFVNQINGNAINDIDATPSFAVSGAAAGDELGFAVAGIGDFNGDGKLDYAFSAPGTDAGGPDRGKVSIRLDGFNQNINGTVDNMRLGKTIDGLGDTNGDGLSDIVITAQGVNNEAYIVNGNAGAPAVTSTISTPHEIMAAGAAGDINGDGFDDIAVSLKMGADVNTYVIFGNNTLPGTINLTYLENPDHALKIHHAGAGSAAEYQITALGDRNGDGFDDLQVGITGQSQYIVNGKIAGGNIPYATDGTPTDGSGATGVLSPNGSSPKALVGDVDFNDNGEMNLSMRGGGSNNNFLITHANFKNIDGGSGTDTIQSQAGNLDFTAVNFEAISQIEVLELTQNSSTVTLSAENIFNLLKTSDDGSLTIQLDAASGVTTGTLNIDSVTDHADDSAGILAALQENGNGAGATFSTDGVTGDHHISIGGYNLYIDGDLAISVA